MSNPAGALLPAVVLVSLTCSSLAAADAPLPSPAPSIVRFQQVAAALYRGGQPDAAGFEQLRRIGIKTVVNLRRNDAERQLVESLGMRYVYLAASLHPFGVGGGIHPDVVTRFFEIVDDPASGPVFLHCRRGADRTGTLIAMYRIARQGWPASAAYEEARANGMRWWHYSVEDVLEDFAARLRAAQARPPAEEPTRP
jgi:protein tyrosine/serine phosphatase